MNKKAKTIINLLEIIFKIGAFITGLSIVMFAILFVAHLFNFDIGNLKNIKINVTTFGQKINDIQKLGRTQLLITLLYTILLATILLNLFLTVLKLLKTISKQIQFSEETTKLIFKLSKLSFYIAIISILMDFFGNVTQGKLNISLDFGNQNFQFLLFSGIIYVIGTVYKNAVRLQHETDLTI